jgi:hypothetical protein
MRWYDGFVLALANLAALIAVLGYSIGSLGGLGGQVRMGVDVLADRPRSGRSGLPTTRPRTCSGTLDV